MSKTKIEWTDFTINPVKGKCPVACNYCYARKMYDRFKWNPELRFVPSVFYTLPESPCRVFVGSTMELFLFDDWMEFILNRCQDFPNHTFQFLTKKPEKLPQFSPFPDNCWVGVTATGLQMFNRAMFYLQQVEAKVKYLSLEPLLEEIPIKVGWLTLLGQPIIQQVIIGAQTKPYKPPKIEWVEEIVRACDKAGIPVFLKENLFELIAQYPYADVLWEDLANLRQEMPV